MGDIRGEHDLPYNLRPGETLMYQADLRRLTQQLMAQNAPQNKRLKAVFFDPSSRRYYTKCSQMTLGEMSDPNNWKFIV
jgi:hypothetical protein